MNKKRELSRVVITGMGVASPLGCSVSEFWQGLLAGASGVDTLTDIDLSRCRTKIGAPVAGYTPEDHFAKKEIKRYSRSSQLALVAAKQAIQDTGLDLDQGDTVRRGVILGSSIGGYTSSEGFFERYFDGWRGTPFIIPKVMNNAPASNISIEYGFTGPLLNLDVACASAAHAIGYAFQQIRQGIIDLAITGGTDSALSPAVMQAWSLMRVLTERNETPKQAYRPFSRDRDGIVLAEGAGILVLESEESALARGAKIYAEVTGYGATSDGQHITQPSLEGPKNAMRLAIEDAGLAIEDIDYINAHATATPWNDSNETLAIKQVFGEHAYQIPVVGIKAAVGHSIAATGALELISTVCSIQDNRVPPTINVSEPDPECDLDYVTEGARQVKIDHAISNAFAFGGSNAVLVVSRYQ
jgi:beta-ketoacyl-acyl-carrier-protein synthase II